MEQRQEMIQAQRPAMLATLAQHMRDASVGAEVFSAVTLITLVISYLLGFSSRSSVIYRAIFDSAPLVWSTLLLAIGVSHLLAFLFPSVLPFIAVRKVCSVVGFVAWVGLLYGLITAGSLAGVLIVAPCLVLLFVAITRRRYVIN